MGLRGFARLQPNRESQWTAVSPGSAGLKICSKGPTGNLLMSLARPPNNKGHELFATGKREASQRWGKVIVPVELVGR